MNNRIQPDRYLVKALKPPSVNYFMQNNPFDAQRWQRYIEQEIGFVLPDVQLQWLVNAVEQTAMSHALTIKQLWQQLPQNDELRQLLLDNVLIHESRFFRHLPSIEFVTQCALQHQRGQPEEAPTTKSVDTKAEALFRIWSVGCASGQETWSLSMSLAAQQLTNYTILGTDISQQAIQKARLAQYDKRQQALIPSECQQFIQPVISSSPKKASLVTASALTSSQEYWQVAPSLRRHVRFVLHNIIEQKPPTNHRQQVIICQNMLLYFRKFDQRDILTRLAKQCAVGGYIVLAPGEALFWRPSNMRRIAHPQVNAWQKISA